MADTCHKPLVPGVSRRVLAYLWLTLTWAAVFVTSQVPFATNCNFDGEIPCGFVQQTGGDDFDWEVGSDPAPSLGLSGDHTGGDELSRSATAACVPGENLTLTNSVTEGYIMSPNYPGNYPLNMDCSWTINAPSAIQLDFVETFDIEPGANCRYDYVRVLDGQGSASPILGKFCGATRPPTLRTVGNVMTVQFRTDGSVQHAGFKAKYSIDVTTTTAQPGTVPNVTSAVPETTLTSRTNTTVPGVHTGKPSLPSVVEGEATVTNDAAISTNLTTTAQPGTVSNVTSAVLETTSSPNTTGVHTGKPIFTMPSLPSVVESEAFAMLECTGEYMQIAFLRSHIPDFDKDHLHLIDPSCKATGNATHLILTAPFEGCGTVKTDTESEIIYFNKVLSHDNDGIAFITRIRELEVPFECRMDSRDTVSAMFSPQIEKIFFFTSAHGKYNFDMQLFQSVTFQQEIDTFPYVVQLNQPLYVQVEVLTPDQDLQLFAENCLATPTANILDPMSYTFISDGCPVDSTFLSLFSSSLKQQRFSINSFAFVKDYPEVYLHCTVMVCNATDLSSRCAQGCLPPSARQKRTAPGTEPRYNVYKGPILNPGYKRPSGTEGVEKSRGVRVPPAAMTSLVIAVGLLLCVVVTLVGVIAYMRRRTAHKKPYMALLTDDLE